MKRLLSGSKWSKSSLDARAANSYQCNLIYQSKKQEAQKRCKGNVVNARSIDELVRRRVLSVLKQWHSWCLARPHAVLVLGLVSEEIGKCATAESILATSTREARCVRSCCMAQIIPFSRRGSKRGAPRRGGSRTEQRAEPARIAAGAVGNSSCPISPASAPSASCGILYVVSLTFRTCSAALLLTGSEKLNKLKEPVTSAPQAWRDPR